MLLPLEKTQLVVGLKQLRRGLHDDRIARVLLAQNAEARVLQPVLELCQEKQIPVEWVATMQQLGKDCGIEVGAAAAGVLREPE